VNWDAIIAETLASLPPPIRARLGNVQILIADVPTQHQKERMDDCDDCGLLGLYEGVPLPDRPEGDEPLMPDRITLFTRAHLKEFAADEVREGFRDTLVHELGHFLGLDDDELAEMGL
jgi:predicted Zn-dependent protease with MMP-like domain